MKRTNNSEPVLGKKKRKSEAGSVEVICLDDASDELEGEENFILFEPTLHQQTVKYIRGRACPWMTKKTADIRDSLLRFHNEIVEFYQYIAATSTQRETRKMAFMELKRIIQSAVEGSDVRQFGSSALGLELPDGDIDVTILVDEDQLKVLSVVYDQLRGDLNYTRLDFRRGKVPIINVHSTKYDFQFDISVNKKDGLKQLGQIQRMTSSFPEFKYLFMVLKCMLKIRGYSQTYHGYVGSYLLFCMVFEYLYQKYDSLSNFSRKLLLSQDLLGFMDFYSSTDWSKHEVYVGRGIWRDRAPSTNSRQGYLSFLSPDDPGNDIGSRAFKIKEVFYCFRNRVQLIRNKNFKRGESILKELLNPSLEEFSYPGRIHH